MGLAKDEIFARNVINVLGNIAHKIAPRLGLLWRVIGLGKTPPSFHGKLTINGHIALLAGQVDKRVHARAIG